tara:strand:+ start:183 stop:332 length:150 start_codon:yes stop_codon:yes gene_type:complete
VKLFYKKDNVVVKKHKNSIKWFQDKTGVTDYQLLWATFLKGVIIAVILL